MGKHKRDKVHAGDAKHEYAPTHFDHALGSVRGTNIRAPQKLIAVPTAPNAAPDTDGWSVHVCLTDALWVFMYMPW